jgi:hypothetical protein
MLDLDELESHADPQVRALVRELRAARDVVEAAWRDFNNEWKAFQLWEKLKAYDAAKEPADER